MRTHFLKYLKIAGANRVLAAEPEFDFYRLKAVRKIVIGMPDDSAEPNEPWLQLQCDYSGLSGTFSTTIHFLGVKELRIPALSPNIRLNEFEIADIRSDGMEGINYEAVTQFAKDFICRCRDIQIVEFAKLG